VPNQPLKLPTEASTATPTPCRHQRRFLESQQPQLPQQQQQQHLQQQQQAVKDVSVDVAVSVSGPAAVSDVFSTLMTSTARTATMVTPTAATSPAQAATTTTHEMANKGEW